MAREMHNSCLGNQGETRRREKLKPGGLSPRSDDNERRCRRQFRYCPLAHNDWEEGRHGNHRCSSCRLRDRPHGRQSEDILWLGEINAYSRFLREIGSPGVSYGQLLWLVRIVLQVCVALQRSWWLVPGLL